MAIILIGTRIYIGGILLVWLNAASTVVFSKTIKRKRLSLMLSAMALSFFWPLAIFSTEGRQRLLLTSTTF